MPARRLRPNLARHAHQVRRYLDSLLPELETGELAGVQAALMYPRRPSLLGRYEVRCLPCNRLSSLKVVE
jgi:hypothetical protein